MELLRIFKQGIVLFEIIAMMIGFFYWKKINKTYWRTLPIYLLIIAIFEIIYYLKLPTTIVYKLTSVIVFIEFAYFYWVFYKNGVNKKLIFTGLILFILAWLIERFASISDWDLYFMSFSYSIGNMILLIFILIYFYNLMNSNAILQFYKQPMFWVASGLLIFYLGTFPYFLLYNLLLKQYFNLLIAYTWVEVFFYYIMFSLFAASFIWGKEK